MNENINEFLENKSLKNEFSIRNLDLLQVFTPTADDLARENEVLRNLLDWVQKYSECRDRKMMETEGYEFPPIDPCISPENDWYIFERWMNGLVVRSKYKDLLPQNYVIKKPEELSDEELLVELQRLANAFEEMGSSMELNQGIPARLVYSYLLESLDEENELLIDGGWTLDGCTGYCPDCFQRPWCEQGCKSCWSEDEEAGKMFLCNSLKEYVSASPVSLQILRKLQSEEDQKFKNFEVEQSNSGISSNPDSTDFSEGYDDIDDTDIPY